LVAAIAVAVLAFAYRYLTFTEFANDDFLHLTTGQQITLGELPVRDFVERGIPLMAVVSAFGQSVLGEGLRSELVLVSMLYAIAAAVCFLLAARLSGSIAVGMAMAAAVILIHPAIYSYPKLLAYALALAATYGYAARPSTARLVLVAATLAAAFLFRHDHGLIAGAGAVAGVAAVHGLTRAGVVTAARLAAIALLLVSPYLAWIQAYEGLGRYVTDGVEFSRREAEKASWGQPPAFGVDRDLPLVRRLAEGPIVHVRWAADLPETARAGAEDRHGLRRLDAIAPTAWRYELTDWSPAALEALVKDPAVADTHHIDRQTFVLQDADVPASAVLTRVYGPAEGLRLGENAMALLYCLVWAAPVAALLALAATWRSASAPVRALVIMAAVVQLGMDLTMLRDPLGVRIREVVLPVAVLTAFVAGILWQAHGGLPLRLAARAGVVVVSLVLVASAATVGEAAPRLASLQLQGIDSFRQRVRRVRYGLAPPQHRTGDRISPVYQELVSYVRRCTAPGSRIFVMTFAPELFFYAGRPFAGGHPSMNPGYFVSDYHAGQILERLSREDVPLVVVDSQTSGEMQQWFPRVAAHVTGRYHEAGRFQIWPDKALVVMTENARPVVRTYEGATHASPLPCFL
jgi:hypothetical protein